ncbi:MAG: CHAT domain-containing protein, partial [Chloroflexi bacterium]|nr:CHAT domain-containing protein [Chloroflexota bacterium]
MADRNTAGEMTTPVRLLILIAGPLVSNNKQPITLLPAQEELAALVDACERLVPPVALEIRAEIATADSIGRVFATTRAPFDILHFTGHGSQEADGDVVLALEDEVGTVRPMGAAELRRLIGERPPRLAFLSACHSEGLARALLDAGARHVVAISAADPVLDIAARTFAERFYQALLSGRAVATAFEAARAAVASNDMLRSLRDPATLLPYSLQEELKFRLLPDDAPAHLQPFISSPPAGAVVFSREPWNRTNLTPVSADPFVGRASELHDIAVKLRNARCVAIHGFGGFGKTALARAAVRWQRERDRWPDGVWEVPLRNVATTAHARAQIALALKLDPAAGESDDTLAAELGKRRSLIVLDDLDVLLQNDQAAVVELLRALLGTHRLKLITTSRRDLPGRVDHQRVELSRLSQRDTIVAFQRYAPPIAEWGTWDPADLFELTKFLDGYPFPIRLAASYMVSTRRGLRELLRNLKENPKGTFRYQGDTEDRDTSLAATLDLSYDSLPAPARAVFPLLALFPAGVTRWAAREIIGAESEVALETLVQHGMAEWRDEAGYQRFALPEPARRYAEARMDDDALEIYAPKALRHYAAVVAAGDRAITEGQIVEGRLWITLEQPNLAQFLEWGYDREAGIDQISQAARATAQLGNYWTTIAARGREETRKQLQRALSAARRIGDRLGEANVRKAIGDVQQFRKETDAALASYQQALALFREIGDWLGEANVRKAIGDVQQFRKETDA